MGAFNLGDALFQLFSLGFLVLLVLFVAFVFRSIKQRTIQLNRLEEKVEKLSNEGERGN
ncbi:flagellar biogenesis protein FliO [Bacillus tianshenii]|uniref:Flagellar biogenesis protein FliO n=1 Tax=Sutcliffiella tianshenii TaxID=1463404 RepID=A0ABS2P3E5_9BACI|nr:DUF4083 domain-containing protein [Bacillus tianshenii]MBM7621137.1 flagellar biogenesis protein FliO [Bacillus tianshenii]